jgi:2,3,4,5-tetrahydropyridine-2-carboxylate N-succinyltransferase
MTKSKTESLFAFGIGVGTHNRNGEWIEVLFPQPVLHPVGLEVAAFAEAFGYQGGEQSINLDAEQRKALAVIDPDYAALVATDSPLCAVFLGEDAAPADVPAAYLKLHLLSHRLVRPNSINLTGVFKILPNVAWTSLGPVDVAELPELQIACRMKGVPLTVHMVDKFPKMTDYVLPPGVRIADASRVRLGAYLGSGTTVMHEGFVNFNAGCEGPNMVEGRISSSVWIGAGTDLGGGSSTMGVLSGGNSTPISLGKNCLLGANAGLGIPLGDDCTVEAGLYLTAASKVRVLNKGGEVTRKLKAIELAGRSGLLFRRNSQDGAIECLPNKKSIELNQDLHSHN